MNYKIILSKLKTNLFRTFLQAICLSISMLFCFLIFLAYKNIEGYLIEKKAGDMVKGSFEITNINGGKKLSENDLLNVKNFGISPSLIYAMNLPSILEIEAFGNKFETDMILYGVSEDLLSGINQNFLPIGVSSSLLDLYNTQIAGNNYPQLSKEVLSLLPINILFGKSQIFETKNIMPLSGKITTFSSNLPLAGVSIPLGTMENISKDFSNKPTLIKIMGVADDKTFENMKNSFTGFNIVSQKEKIQSVQDSLENFRKILGLFVFLVIGFLVFVIVYSILSQKQENEKLFFIYRLHGARKGQLFSIIFVESSFYILVAGSIIFLANKIFDTSYFNQKLFDTAHIQYDIKPLSGIEIEKIILLHFVLLISISFLVNYKSILRKFEN